MGCSAWRNGPSVLTEMWCDVCLTNVALASGASGLSGDQWAGQQGLDGGPRGVGGMRGVDRWVPGGQVCWREGRRPVLHPFSPLPSCPLLSPLHLSPPVPTPHSSSVLERPPRTKALRCPGLWAAPHLRALVRTTDSASPSTGRGWAMAPGDLRAPASVSPCVGVLPLPLYPRPTEPLPAPVGPFLHR